MMRAVLYGVVEFLKERLLLNPREVGVRLRGQPPASGGQVYYGVYPTLFSHGPSEDQIRGLDVQSGFIVAITVRTGAIPPDRIPDVIYDPIPTSLASRTMILVRTLHVYRHELLGYINNNLEPGDPHLFIEPFDWVNTSPEPEPVGPEWFWSEDDSKIHYGFKTESEFSRGRRLENHHP